MATVQQVAMFLEAFAPPQLAAEWDNIGLLAGDRERTVGRAMTCLTITPDSAAEAIAEGADLVITHHPLPFKPLNRITTDTPEGKLLWDLISAGISIYSSHTAFDSARGGINQMLAEGLGLSEIVPLLEPSLASPGAGTGRRGNAGFQTLSSIAESIKRFLGIERVQLVGDPATAVTQVAIACGSAGEFARPASDAGCDCLVTGETRFHTCLEAESLGLGLILTGHYASERFALERLAGLLAENFAEVQVWASRRERDPLRWA